MYRYAFLIIALVALVFAGCDENSTRTARLLREMPPVTEAPVLPITDINGRTFKLSEYRGKIILVDFWASWCGPCIKSIPDLVELQKQYARDLVIIGVSLDKHPEEAVPPCVEYFGINYKMARGDSTLAAAFGGVELIPSSFLIDRNGTITKRHIGMTPKEQYQKEIDGLING